MRLIQIHSLTEQISAEAILIFEDASEEFSELAAVLIHFEEWRNRDITSYKDTYFSLWQCLPKVKPVDDPFPFYVFLISELTFQIVGPMIRLNMITWNPLDEKCKDFERMEWYKTIMKYGYKVNETEADLADDPDVRLMPTLVEKIILPKLMEFIEEWDPVSSTQNIRLVNLLRRLIRDYPSLKPTSKFMRAFFTSILDKMKLSLENDVFIPIFPKQ